MNILVQKAGRAARLAIQAIYTINRFLALPDTRSHQKGAVAYRTACDSPLSVPKRVHHHHYCCQYNCTAYIWRCQNIWKFYLPLL